MEYRQFRSPEPTWPTMEIPIIGSCAMSLEMSPLARCGVFFKKKFLPLRGPKQPTFRCILRHFPRGGISDDIAHEPIIGVVYGRLKK